MGNLLVAILSTLVVLVVLSLVRSITTFIHEIGHAIPSLLLTNGEVTLYIGSYGDPQNSFNLSLGRLKIYFKYNPIHWKVGLCTRSKDDDTSYLNAFLIIVFGPLTSLIFGFSVCSFLYINANSEKYIFLGFILLSSSLIDFIINIVPQKKAIRLNNGNIVFNDGEQIIQLLKFKINADEYTQANKLYSNKEFLKASQKYMNIVEKGLINHHLFQLTISSLLNAKKYEKAESIFSKHKSNYHLTSIDFSNAGLIYSYLNQESESLEMYTEAIKLNPKNTTALNNRGFQLNLIGKYQKAINDFDQVIAIDKEFTYALNNRGHSKIELGFEEEGLIDILDSIKIKKDNPYAYRNLGIYYMKKKNKIEALKYLKKSYKLDKEIFGIDKLIQQAESIK